MMQITSILFGIFISVGHLHAQEAPPTQPIYILNRAQTAIFSAPNKKAEFRKARKGIRLQGTGKETEGFLQVQTKSGKTYWVQALDVKVEVAPENYEKHRAVANEEAAEDEASDFKRWTFDLGASVGSYNDKNYSEVNLGLNYYMYRWLAWRNAAFARFASGVDTIFGLDSSARGIFSTGNSALGLVTFAGPGYRFVNEGKNVPFVEGGVVFRVAGFSLGGGVKTFFNKMVSSSATENDTQFFIILSGSGSL